MLAPSPAPEIEVSSQEMPSAADAPDACGGGVAVPAGADDYPADATAAEHLLYPRPQPAVTPPPPTATTPRRLGDGVSA